MTPPRTILILVAVIALPTLLTFLSLLHSHPRRHVATESTDNPSKTGLRALFSFHTPSTLFPPSAIISLTDDNSTFFLARPADFGPDLVSKGLSGQLWIGSGFGDDGSGRGGADTGAEGELGCSDVPGWDEFSKIVRSKDTVIDPKGFESSEVNTKNGQVSQASQDGTDDHLHHPLPTSGVSKPSEPGQPAEHEDPQPGSSATHGDIQSLQEGAEISGKVVLLSRGGCGFLEKVKWAQRRGASALIVGDHTRGAPLVTMYARGDTSNVSIPSLFTSHTTAHLLSSLIPIDNTAGESEDGHDEVSHRNGKMLQSSGDDSLDLDRPTFTTSLPLKPTTVPQSQRSRNERQHVNAEVRPRKGWTRSLFSRSKTAGLLEDSTRPPSSGRLDWWNPTWRETPTEEKDTKYASREKSKIKHSSKDSWWRGSHSMSTDDFVIGVQDWRDPDLVAAQTTPSKGTVLSTTTVALSIATVISKAGKIEGSENPFSGGSITPGSGRYNHPGDTPDVVEQINYRSTRKQDVQVDALNKDQSSRYSPVRHDDEADDEHEGLWVTLTPTTMSTSPFFDTLLVLVVSPLVTLTVVYALLLLRSRIRRRRWRAPKSVVERLPIRTYHTMSTSSTTSSTRFASPNTSNPTSPLLQSHSQTAARVRSRAATATGVGEAVSESLERATNKANETGASHKKYHGKQIECVVCLEEYIDGKSKVMSLPCGHDFHAECM